MRSGPRSLGDESGPDFTSALVRNHINNRSLICDIGPQLYGVPVTRPAIRCLNIELFAECGSYHQISKAPAGMIEANLIWKPTLKS